MERRTCIQTVMCAFIPITGCIGNFQDQTNQTETSENQTNQTETSKVDQMLTASVNQPANETDVSIEAEFVSQPTDEEPARLQIQFTNKAESERQFHFGPSPPLSTYINGRGEIEELVIIPKDMSKISIRDRNDDNDFRLIPEESEDGCWRVEDQIIGEDILITQSIKSGDSITEAYTVLAGTDNDPCISAGQYQFEGSFEIEGEWFDWELTITKMN